ncbi:hypothetical protein [Kocuria palustris]|uniref:hypothetical protein n=1 Tax=Kocuria palustris TaxID=71999 RepID=UPI00077B7DB5|nr:hypothetical protein [Kocuria palustris]
MSTNRTLRTPLTVGMLAVTAAFGLSACVPTEEPAVEETEATQPAETETEQSAETERPSEESSDSGQDSSEAPSEDTDDSAASTDAKASGKATEGSDSSDSKASGDTVDAGAMNGEPIEVIEGEGGGTVEIPEHDEPLVVVFENTSEDEYSYVYGSADKGQTLSGVEAGESATFLLDPYGSSGGLASNTSSWDMEAEEGDTYTLSFYEMDALPEAGDGDTIEAEGSGVFRWNSEEDAYMGVEHDGESNFIVHGESPMDDGTGTQYVFNEIGAVTGGLEIEEGEYIIAVDADGKWSFTPMTEGEYESASSDS